MADPIKSPPILLLIAGAVLLVFLLLLGGLILVAFLGYNLSMQKAPAVSNVTLCPSGVNEGPNGTCCAYVCNTTCSGGYKPNTCRCECLDGGKKSVANTTNNSTPKIVQNLGNVFEEPSANFSMPPLPG